MTIDDIKTLIAADEWRTLDLKVTCSKKTIQYLCNWIYN